MYNGETNNSALDQFLGESARRNEAEQSSST